MKLYLKLSAFAAVLAVGTLFASADTIASSSGTTSLYGVILVQAPPPPGSSATPASFFITPGGSPTATLNAGGVWDNPFAGSDWVGGSAFYGPGAGEINPPYGFYLYGEQFTTSGFLTSLNVMADDTVSVFLNGNNIITPGVLGTDTHCSDSAPSCTQNLEGSFSGSVAFNSGDILWFVVEQAGTGPAWIHGGDPSGLDYIGTTVGPVPEPSSLILLGTGLLGTVGAMVRRMRRAS